MNEKLNSNSEKFIKPAKRLSGPRKLFTGGTLLLVAAGCRGVAQGLSTPSFLPSENPLATSSFEPTPSQTPDITLTPTPSLTPEVTPTPTSEVTPQPKVVAEVRTGLGSEPSVAASPYDKNLVAMSYNYVALHAGVNQDGVRISQDGGKTWKEVAREPWQGHIPDYHGVVAWGPGETPGSSRLWWTDAIVLGKPVTGEGTVAQSVAYSDDLGQTWNFHIFENTPRWIGGFPNLTVDNNPQSPNFGTAYVAYNWLESAKGPGLAVAASKDGKNWQVTQVPAHELDGYPDYWRINYRVKTDSQGNAYVLFYQSNLKYWSTDNIFSQGGPSNIGEMEYYLAKLSYDHDGTLQVDYVLPTTSLKGSSQNVLYDPQWESGFAIDQNDNPWMAFSSSGKLIIGEMPTDPKNETPWMEFSMSGAECFKPSLTVGIHNEIIVGFHAVTNGMVGTYFMVSYDDGENWQPPQLVTKSIWRLSSISNVLNNTGLRESMDVGPDGEIYYTYADPRSGELSTYVAVIDLGDNKTPSQLTRN